jgi:hypothetical protein
MDRVSIKNTNIFLCKALQNLPKFGLLVWKQTIWQPCGRRKARFAALSENVRALQNDLAFRSSEQTEEQRIFYLWSKSEFAIYP